MRSLFPIVVVVMLSLSVGVAVAAPSPASMPPEPQIAISKSGLSPFGAELFQGNFAQGFYDGLNEDYIVLPGDRVRLQLWGAQAFDGVLEVDARGNLFLPEIGPVRVEGMKHSKLESAVQQKVRSVFTQNVEVYVNLLKPQPVGVFVSGFVTKPGRYAGGPTDSVLYFLDLAGGIDPDRGSYRDIRILRQGRLLQSIDLYPFLREGRLNRPRLEDGDVILVGERGPSAAVEGSVRFEAAFEFVENGGVLGAQVKQLASPENKASHVSVVGTRQGVPYNVYLPVEDFAQLPIEDGDRIRFHADTPGDTIMVAAQGAIVGASRYPVVKGTRLNDLLHHIAVEPELANLKGIHILRRSVAERQKKALDEALVRLEQSSLTATSQSVDEANIRVREAELIAKFVEKARQVQPDGTLVVGREGEITDVYLENGDEVVIPLKSDVVLVAGEVMMPQAIVYQKNWDVDDYVLGAGGYSDRADKNHILVVKPSGEVVEASQQSIARGDKLLILPEFDSKSLQLVKDITQILYQIAVATKVALDL